MALDPERRARIVLAATDLFSAYGYRRTSMDQLAHAAGVAKPTLYAYFTDKEAVFVTVVDTVLSRVIDDVDDAITAGGDVEQTIVDVLDAKFGRLYVLVHSSPHAADLLSSSTEGPAGAIVATADAAFVDRLTSVVRSAERAGVIDLRQAGVTRRHFVVALLQAAHGADAMASSPADHTRLMRSQVRLLLAGVGYRHEP